jgi:fatty-acyl-CoA synthase
MARYKVPYRVFALERFPMTTGPNGVKVRKEALRELARDLCASMRLPGRTSATG